MEPTLVLWGDSHAAQLIPVFRAFVTESGTAALILTKAGCAPLPNVEMLPNNEMRSTCSQFNERVLEKLQSLPDLQAVILAGRWSIYLSGAGYLSDGTSRVDLPHSLAIFQKTLLVTSQDISAMGARPILATVAPTGERIFSCVARADYLGLDPNPCSTKVYEQTSDQMEQLLHLIPGEQAIGLLRYLPTLCPSESCQLFDHNNYGLLDDVHLSKHSVTQLMPQLRQLFAPGPSTVIQ
ncbi:SGNH hydrolase domain-containing protein [Actibacterium sp. D379-3]